MSENKEKEGSARETTRTRSPNYPAIPLEEAINRARTIYEQEHTHVTAPDVVAKAMDYGGLNGTSRTMISALKKFGLLQAEGNGLKISDDAVDIFELPKSDTMAQEARKRAAFKPTLFAEFRETYGEQLPSDLSLRHTLIKRGFNPRTAGEVIQIYKDTVASVEGGAEESVGNVKMAGQKEQDEVGQPLNLFSTPPANSPPMTTPLAYQPVAPPEQGVAIMPTSDGAFTEALLCRTSANSRARVLFEGTVTKEAVNKLISYLRLSRDDYPEQNPPVEQINSTNKASSELSPSEVNDLPEGKASGFEQIGPALWRASDADHEVEIVGYAGERNGIHYLYTASGTGLPVSEVEFFDDED